MARTRLAHRFSLLSDRDVLHSLAVTGLACIASVGLVYAAYLLHVVRTARNAPVVPAHGRRVLLFGKHAPQGRLDTDFEARVARAAALWRARPPEAILLLGGGAEGTLSEAAIAREALFARGLPPDAPLVIEDRSRDTLQNLRNARTLLQAGDSTDAAGCVTLLSSRYHLARCALFARGLGLRWELCAAEPALSWRPMTAWRLAGEAAYVCWVDIGTRWARLIRHQRMLAKVG
ncbi:YdcF family protein [Luteimonas aestuarii]|uniref:YdcF family protein n=1 Tax=Luteimonas aestuarii TaxID=453837 RepID=A0A4R5U0L0_9GAMM|nr:YdcF family protein [Luteimonas aestuarii]TDK27118.1 YdcF family protein [Luteimonas aestuarii]